VVSWCRKGARRSSCWMRQDWRSSKLCALASSGIECSWDSQTPACRLDRSCLTSSGHQWRIEQLVCIEHRHVYAWAMRFLRRRWTKYRWQTAAQYCSYRAAPW
jgi:hypothetical protein